MIGVGRFLDRAIGVVAPGWAAQRMAARATMAQIDAFMGDADTGYAAGKKPRGKRRSPPVTERQIDVAQIDWIRAQAWKVYRDNVHARKIVRTIGAKTLGRGVRPQPLVADAKFHARALELWNEFARQPDSNGAPGQGGLTLAELLHLALRKTVLSGEVLVRKVLLTPAEQRARGAAVPLQLQLIDAGRLAHEPAAPVAEGHKFYRGIELDAGGRRVAYHLHDEPEDAASPVRRVPTGEFIAHLYVCDDVDQLRGLSWFAPAVLQVSDTADYQYNELKASAMAACFVMGYRKPTGKSRLGLASPDGDEEEDADGNPITRMQPGMVVNLGKDGELSGINPARPGGNAEGFIAYMLRAISCAFPGVKSSTVTGDYRNSSFSSERSADNDAWPELEIVQDWFAGHLLQPLWEQLIRAAIVAGWFDGHAVTAAQFNANPSQYTACNWQGPVARSINPVDDAQAAKARISAGTSTPQIEAANVGRDWRQILQQTADFYKAAFEMDLPEEYVNNILSIGPDDVVADPATDPAVDPPADPPTAPN